MRMMPYTKMSSLQISGFRAGRATDRFMLCGSPFMLKELRAMFTARGFFGGNHSWPGHFVIEKAFVDR
jgi:ferredoxin--NADP+ reductase